MFEVDAWNVKAAVASIAEKKRIIHGHSVAYRAGFFIVGNFLIVEQERWIVLCHLLLIGDGVGGNGGAL
jgi:hypothetical protein